MLATPDRWNGPLAKIRRAKHHFKELEAKLAPNSVNKAYSVITKQDGPPGQYIVEITSHPWNEAEWSVIVGEIVHDLHSALDHTICILSRINKPADDCAGLEFPFAKQPLGPNEKRQNMGGTPDDARAIIERHQPHTMAAWAPERHPLWQLRVLSNRDKHRELAFLSGLTISEHDAGLFGQPTWGIYAWEFTALTPTVLEFKDGTRRTTYTIPPPEVSVQTNPPTVYITFVQPADLRGIDVLLSVWRMVMTVEGVVRDLRADFP